MVALGPPGDDRDGDDDGTDDRGDPAMQDVGGHRVGERREERPAHERPVRVDEGRVGRGHVRSEQQQRERRGGAESGKQREPLARTADRQPRRIAGPNCEVDEQADEGHRRGQVGGDRLPAVAEPDRLAAEPRLEADEADGDERRPQDRSPLSMVEERDDGETEDLEADDDGNGPMDPLDPRLRVIEWRDQLAVAERPVRAAEARIRGPHDDPDRDKQERGRERQPRRASGSGSKCFAL